MVEGRERVRGDPCPSLYVGRFRFQRAEGEGFEPSVRLDDAQRFSRPPHSTTLPPLREGGRHCTAGRRRLRGARGGGRTRSDTLAGVAETAPMSPDLTGEQREIQALAR